MSIITHSGTEEGEQTLPGEQDTFYDERTVLITYITVLQHRACMELIHYYLRTLQNLHKAEQDGFLSMYSNLQGRIPCNPKSAA